MEADYEMTQPIVAPSGPITNLRRSTRSTNAMTAVPGYYKGLAGFRVKTSFAPSGYPAQYIGKLKGYVPAVLEVVKREPTKPDIKIKQETVEELPGSQDEPEIHPNAAAVPSKTLFQAQRSDYPYSLEVAYPKPTAEWIATEVAQSRKERGPELGYRADKRAMIKWNAPHERQLDQLHQQCIKFVAEISAELHSLPQAQKASLTFAGLYELGYEIGERQKIQMDVLPWITMLEDHGGLIAPDFPTLCGC